MTTDEKILFRNIAIFVGVKFLLYWSIAKSAKKLRRITKEI